MLVYLWARWIHVLNDHYLVRSGQSSHESCLVIFLPNHFVSWASLPWSLFNLPHNTPDSPPDFPD